MNIHLNEYFLKSAWGWSGLALDICVWKTSSPNKEMQALSECVKASQDPRCRSNRPWTSQVWRPATGAGWKHPTWCSPTQTRRTGSRLPRAEAAAATTTTSTTTMRNPGIMRRPKSLHLTIFVNEIKTSIQKPFSFREAKKWLPLQIHRWHSSYCHCNADDLVMWPLCCVRAFTGKGLVRIGWRQPL